MNLENAKGTKDFAPVEKIMRNEVVAKLTSVFEKYGFSPLETPLIEKYDLMLAKGGAGEESDALKEVFKLSDNGERKLALKFEQTLSFARFIGMNPTIKMPFKRYEIGPVFRDGPIKLGRYRQFWQCDVDIVGSNSMGSDAEIINLAFDAFKSLDIDAVLEVNNRKFLKGLIEWSGIKKNDSDSVIISIDKFSKIGRDGVLKELKEKHVKKEAAEKLLDAIELDGSNEDKLNKLKDEIDNKEAQEGLAEIEQVLSFFSKDYNNKLIFNPTLARGLGYYTGTIFEGFAKDANIKSSICGGGRYDKMISSLIKSDKEYPCVGISFGLDTTFDVLNEKNKSDKKTVTQVYVIPIKTTIECFAICKKLREEGINVDMDFSGKGISKNLDFANALGIPFVLIAGPKELEENKVKIKNMKTGEENTLSLSEISNFIKN